MKFCTRCGTKLVDEAVVCTNCGCSVGAPGRQGYGQPYQGQAPYGQSYQYQPPYGQPYYGQPPYYGHHQVDQVDAGLVVLAVLIPLFGFIYWPIKSKETPKKARACGIAAIISWAVSFFIIVMSGALSYLYW